MALGAQTADVLRLVLKQGMTPVVLLRATAAGLGFAALPVCLFPARKATLLKPVHALRAE